MASGPAKILTGVLGNMSKGDDQKMQRLIQPMPSMTDLASQSNFGQKPIPEAPVNQQANQPVNQADPQGVQQTIERLRSGFGRGGRQEALKGLLDMFQ